MKLQKIVFWLTAIVVAIKTAITIEVYFYNRSVQREALHVQEQEGFPEATRRLNAELDRIPDMSGDEVLSS